MIAIWMKRTANPAGNPATANSDGRNNPSPPVCSSRLSHRNNPRISRTPKPTMNGTTDSPNGISDRPPITKGCLAVQKPYSPPSRMPSTMAAQPTALRAAPT